MYPTKRAIKSCATPPWHGPTRHAGSATALAPWRPIATGAAGGA